MRKRTVFPIVIWVIALVACSPANDSRLAIDTLPGGIVQVVNAGPTAWADSSGWQLTLERVISPDENSPGALARPRSMATDNAGNLYVFDLQPAQIKVFDADGEFSHLIGREGEGPGEYRAGAVHVVGDTVVVHDAGNSRVVLFGTDGAAIGEWSAQGSRQGASPGRHDGAFPSIVNLRDRELTADDQFPGRAWRFHHADGTPAGTVRIPAMPRSPMWELRNDRMDVGAFIPFAATREAVLTPSGTVVWGDSDEYRLIVSTNGEDTVRIITAQAPRSDIPDSVRQAAFDEFVTSNEWIADVGKVSDIPRQYPQWLMLSVDADDNIWVQRADASGLAADVFTSDGVLLGTVATPFEFNTREHWVGDRLFHTSIDESGRPVVEVYRVIR